MSGKPGLLICKSLQIKWTISESALISSYYNRLNPDQPVSSSKIAPISHTKNGKSTQMPFIQKNSKHYKLHPLQNWPHMDRVRVNHHSFHITRSIILYIDMNLLVAGGDKGRRGTDYCIILLECSVNPSIFMLLIRSLAHLFSRLGWIKQSDVTTACHVSLSLYRATSVGVQLKLLHKLQSNTVL